MASAYLIASEGLLEAFRGAQEDRAVRWLHCRIEGENIVLVGPGAAAGAVADDFAELKPVLAPNEPSFVLFCIDATPPVGEGAPGTARHWMLLSWVPDDSPPRLKMLYSSSRENFKKQLGHGFFADGGEYYANEPDDVAWGAYEAATRKEPKEAAPLTETERMGREADALEAVEAAAGKSAAMQALSFAFDNFSQAH